MVKEGALDYQEERKHTVSKNMVEHNNLSFSRGVFSPVWQVKYKLMTFWYAFPCMQRKYWRRLYYKPERVKAYFGPSLLTDSATLENSCGIFFFFPQTEHILCMLPTHHTSGHWSQRNENICSHRNLYIDLHSSSLWNNRKLEKTKSAF